MLLNHTEKFPRVCGAVPIKAPDLSNNALTHRVRYGCSLIYGTVMEPHWVQNELVLDSFLPRRSSHRQKAKLVRCVTWQRLPYHSILHGLHHDRSGQHQPRLLSSSQYTPAAHTRYQLKKQKRLEPRFSGFSTGLGVAKEGKRKKNKSHRENEDYLVAFGAGLGRNDVWET